MRSRGRKATVAVATFALCAGVGAPVASAWADDGVTTVATGFAGPLHLAVGPDGVLWVADAFGRGQIDRVDPLTATVTPVATDLGFSPGVAVHGQQVFYTISSSPEEGRGQGPTSLQRLLPSGRTTQVADLLAYELAHNPDGQGQGTADDADSNPYSVLALPGRTIVADSAGNDLVQVAANGHVSTLTVFPVSTAGDCATQPENGGGVGCDPVPTDVELGPDGYLYVSGLGAFAEGFVWKVDARTGAIVATLTGFPPLTGIAVGPDGSIYAASLLAGVLVRIAPDGSRTVAHVPAADVETAGSVLYATTVSLRGDAGSVVRVSPSAFGPLPVRP